jgi:UDP-N-acetylglucosamine 4,6-dehydratase/5-epimerase
MTIATRLFDDATVLVTGGTGSLGSKLMAELLTTTRVRKVICLSRDELKQSEMLKNPVFGKSGRFRQFLGDVRDQGRLDIAFRGVDYIVHAAALKQVPALEYNPFEAIKTNVLGTQNVVNAAIANHVEKVLLVSTDKACEPANLYGATKLCAEKLFQTAGSYSHGSTFAVLRYGNVIGSRGSVIPLFAEQAKTGTITVTDPDMTRFVITLDQAVTAISFAMENTRGGEIFVPLLAAMRIGDLAEIMARDTANVQITGARPGEKLHEVLVTSTEKRGAVFLCGYYVLNHSGRIIEREGAKAPSNMDPYTSDREPTRLRGDALRNVVMATDAG